MRDLFISHVEEDADIALELARGLEEVGYATWYFERDSIAGVSYLEQTGGAVDDCRAFVLVISPHSLGSNQVTAEVVRAHEGSRPIFPVLRGISHVEFQSRQPVWRQAVGSAASVSLPAHGVGPVVSRIVKGLQIMGIHPEHKPEGKDAAVAPRPAAPTILQRLGLDAGDMPLWRRPPGWAACAAIALLALLVLVAVVVAVALARPGAPKGTAGTGATAPQPTHAQALASPATATPPQAKPAAAGSLAPALTLGTPVEGSLQDTGDVKFYQVSASAGERLIVLLDSNDNSTIHQLYVRFGSLPTLTEYDDKGDLPNADQEVEVASTQEGTYYLMVCADHWGGKYTIVAHTESTFPTLALGTPVEGSLQDTGDVKFYQLSISAGERLTVLLDSNDNNTTHQLYIRFGSLPDPKTYDDKGDLPDADQGVEVAGTQEGTYYLMVCADHWGGKYTIVAHTESTFPTLAPGTAVQGALQDTADVRFYQVPTLAGERLLVVLDSDDNNTTHQLYIRFGSLPDLAVYDSKGEMPNADQVVEVASTQAGAYYLMVRADHWGGRYTIAAQE